MDPIQLLTIFVTITLTVLFVILSIQVMFILKEFRFTVHKVNKMLDDGGKVTGTVSQSVEGMSGFVNGIKTGLQVFGSLRPNKENHE